MGWSSLDLTMTKAELQSLLNVVIVNGRDKGCIFIKGRDWSQYTKIKGMVAHRYVYKMCVGPLKQGQEICHKCDRKGCINPDHLFQGTHSDNMRDARNKKRIVNIRVTAKIPKELIEKDRWRQLVRFAIPR